MSMKNYTWFQVCLWFQAVLASALSQSSTPNRLGKPSGEYVDPSRSARPAMFAGEREACRVRPADLLERYRAVERISGGLIMARHMRTAIGWPPSGAPDDRRPKKTAKSADAPVGFPRSCGRCHTSSAICCCHSLYSYTSPRGRSQDEGRCCESFVQGSFSNLTARRDIHAHGSTLPAEEPLSRPLGVEIAEEEGLSSEPTI